MSTSFANNANSQTYRKEFYLTGIQNFYMEILASVMIRWATLPYIGGHCRSME